MFTGIGGQGVQLAAQILARAATDEGHHVTLLGTYGGTMRGGNTDSTLIIGDAPISSPPMASRLACGLAMHPAHWGPVEKRLRPRAIVLFNASLFDEPVALAEARIHSLPATRMAGELGNPLTASLVLIAAFAGLTGLVPLDSLITGMRASVPVYRQQHIDANTLALSEGFGALADSEPLAWADTEAWG